MSGGLDSVLANPAEDKSVAAALALRVRTHASQARIVGSLTLGELVAYSAYAQRSGLYVVFHEGSPVYVGSCRSQPYLVRIPAHLAVEAGDYMNSLAKARHRVQPAGGTLRAAAEAVAADCSILLLTVNRQQNLTTEERRTFVRALIQLEHELQTVLDTAWNNIGRRSKISDRIAMAEEAESARIEHESFEAYADGAPDADAASAAALDALGVKEGWGIVVKVRRSWQEHASGAERQKAVLGDWDCSTASAEQVRVVVAVSGAKIVEAWRVKGFEEGEDGCIRFKPVGSAPLDVGDVPLPQNTLRARGHRYLRRITQA